MVQILNALYLNKSVVTMEYAFVKFIELIISMSMKVNSYLILKMKKLTDNKKQSVHVLFPL